MYVVYTQHTCEMHAIYKQICDVQRTEHLKLSATPERALPLLQKPISTGAACSNHHQQTNRRDCRAGAAVPASGACNPWGARRPPPPQLPCTGCGCRVHAPAGPLQGRAVLLLLLLLAAAGAGRGEGTCGRGGAGRGARPRPAAMRSAPPLPIARRPPCCAAPAANGRPPGGAWHAGALDTARHWPRRGPRKDKAARGWRGRRSQLQPEQRARGGRGASERARGAAPRGSARADGSGAKAERSKKERGAERSKTQSGAKQQQASSSSGGRGSAPGWPLFLPGRTPSCFFLLFFFSVPFFFLIVANF